jgi:CRISPR-associated protein Csx10
MSSSNWISVTPQSPIHIGESKPNFSFLPTKDVIPGSILRGALAEYLIMEGRESEINEFITNMRFGFLYPSNSPVLLPSPLPTSTLECKTNPGFQSKESSKESHGIFDTLMASVAYEELKTFTEFPVPLTFKCKECGKRMDKVSGFYTKERGQYKKVEVKRTSQTKVAISRRRKASESEMLYSITAIRPKIDFVGKIVGDMDKLENLLDALNEVGIGALTTRGYGVVKAKEADIKIEEGLEERVKLFNRRLEAVWSDIASIALNKDSVPKEPTGTYFSVDVLSPAILRDYNGLSTLKLQLNLDGKRMDPVLFSAYPDFIGGWSTAWGLPKATIYGAGTGSTYVFKVDEEGEWLFKELARIELEGIGKMKDEGYGDVLICHPFHREVMQA